MAPQGRMRGAFAVPAREQAIAARPPLISQRSGPLTASPKGEANASANFMAAFTNNSPAGIMNKNYSPKDVPKIELSIFAKLNIRRLTVAFGSLRTEEVVVTEERLEHIRLRHPEDFALFQTYGKQAIEDPDIIAKDEKHENTVFVIRQLPETNLNVVVRLVLDTDEPNYKNSVITFYRLRQRNLKKLLEKNPVLYKKE